MELIFSCPWFRIYESECDFKDEYDYILVYYSSSGRCDLYFGSLEMVYLFLRDAFSQFLGELERKVAL